MDSRDERRAITLAECECRASTSDLLIPVGYSSGNRRQKNARGLMENPKEIYALLTRSQPQATRPRSWRGQWNESISE